jgi:hypothetical protein
MNDCAPPIEPNHAPLRWENVSKARYYEVRVCRDLFGAAVVLCHWGGIGSKLGGSQEKVVPDQAVATVLAEISRRRLQRGYAPCLATSH